MASAKLPGLNGVRFIAAMAVIIGHIEAFKHFLSFPNLWSNDLMNSLPAQGVNVFFVLSGFLITYLLLNELQGNGKIALKRFYLRRALRILPLYYLVITAALLIFPHFGWSGNGPLAQFIRMSDGELVEHYSKKLFLFFGMLPNVAFHLYKPILLAAVTWSIGVEEQFYLLWPLLLNWASGNCVRIFLLVIPVKILLVNLPHLWRLPSPGNAFYAAFHVFSAVLGGARIETLAMGAVGAYWITRESSCLNYLISPVAQKLAVPGLIALFMLGGVFTRWSILIAFFYMVFLCNIAKAPASFLNGRVIDFLGRISYGIYLYHSFVIIGCLAGIQHLGGSIRYGSGWGFNVILYGGSMTLTILLSALSYYGFEMPFLRLKAKYGSRLLENPRSLTSSG